MPRLEGHPLPPELIRLVSLLIPIALFACRSRLDPNARASNMGSSRAGGEATQAPVHLLLLLDCMFPYSMCILAVYAKACFLFF